jgi:hypothetical protein
VKGRIEMINQLAPIHWFLILLLSVLAIGCLVLVIRLFNVELPIDRRNQLERSLKIGGLTVLFSIIGFLIIGVFIWAETGVSKSIVIALPMLCLVPFVFALSVLGTYIQFFWYTKLSKFKDDTIRKQVEKLESPNQK